MVIRKYIYICSGSIILSLMVLSFPSVSIALSTDDMLRLRRAGIAEDIIVLMAESGYQDADKVLKLKQAGFKDQSIMAIVKGEAKNNEGKERITFETSGKAKIMWYLVQRGKSIAQNSKTLDNAKVCVVDDTSIKLEWAEKGGMGLLDEFKVKGFPSPFYWVLNRDDTLSPGDQGYSLMLQSTVTHQGKPDSDGYHYWQLLLAPQHVEIADHLKNILQTLKISGH